MKRLTYVAVVALIALLLPIPVLGAGDFTDVDDSNVFKADIDWLAEAGVTLGCNPPANDRFCPEAVVTRQQMAAFMHRLAASRVVDAATAQDAETLDGLDSISFLQKKETAADSDLLDGLDSTSFLQKLETAADSDLLDGLDSTAYLLDSEQAADSDLLDGLDSSDFAAVTDVYTRAEIDASPEAWLKAGGNVDKSGELTAHIVNWGGAKTSRTSTGTYAILLESLGPGCGYDFPLPIVSARAGTAVISGSFLSCSTGDATINVETRDDTGALANLSFTFLVYSNSSPDLSQELVGELGYTRCEYNLDSGERVCT